MDVHLRDLRYFAAVAHELHFTRAAERLFVSQPALSKQVRALERQLGVELFVRDRREVRLTEAGTLLRSHAETVLAGWDAATGALDALRAAGTLVVGMSTGPGRGGLLPAIRSRYCAAWPDVELKLRQVGWDDSSAGLASGNTDVAFVWLPMADEAAYRTLVVAEEPRVVAMSETHRLAALSSVTPADLFDERMLALPPAAGPLREHWLLTEERAGHPVTVGAVVHSLDETFEALAEHGNIVVLAAGNAPLLTRDGIVVRPIEAIAPSRLALAWRRDDHRPAVTEYVRAARQVVRQRNDSG